MVLGSKKSIPKSKKVAVGSKKKDGWQAEKSALTRRTILDAAVNCLIEIGYAKTTTALIAEYAGVSRGAMMHHFPSRSSVIEATIKYLSENRLEEYKHFMIGIDDPRAQMDRQRIQESVQRAWRYVNHPLSIAYQEVLMAARTDVELAKILEPLEKQYEKEFMQVVKAVFPHWQALEVLEVANDLVQFLLNGMMLTHMKSREKARTKRILEFLVDALEDFYTHTGDKTQKSTSY